MKLLSAYSETLAFSQVFQGRRKNVRENRFFKYLERLLFSHSERFMVTADPVLGRWLRWYSPKHVLKAEIMIIIRYHAALNIPLV